MADSVYAMRQQTLCYATVSGAAPTVRWSVWHQSDTAEAKRHMAALMGRGPQDCVHSSASAASALRTMRSLGYTNMLNESGALRSQVSGPPAGVKPKDATNTTQDEPKGADVAGVTELCLYCRSKCDDSHSTCPGCRRCSDQGDDVACSDPECGGKFVPCTPYPLYSPLHPEFGAHCTRRPPDGVWELENARAIVNQRKNEPWSEKEHCPYLCDIYDSSAESVSKLKSYYNKDAEADHVLDNVLVRIHRDFDLLPFKHLSIKRIEFVDSCSDKQELPATLTHLTLGEFFNEKLDLQGTKITHLTLGEFFNEELDLRGTKITHLARPVGYDKIVKYPTHAWQQERYWPKCRYPDCEDAAADNRLKNVTRSLHELYKETRDRAALYNDPNLLELAKEIKKTAEEAKEANDSDFLKSEAAFIEKRNQMLLEKQQKMTENHTITK